MKKYLLMSAAMFTLVSGSVLAADDATSATGSGSSVESSAPGATGGRHHMTLEEARKRAHERADKLDKMTEAEYGQQQQKHQAWREKWKAMSPEEKAAYKKDRAARRHNNKVESGDTSAPTASTSSSAAPAPAPSASTSSTPAMPSTSMTPSAPALTAAPGTMSPTSPTVPAEVAAPPMPAATPSTENR